MKISKLLPIALAFAMCTTAAQAANTADVEYQLSLPAYFNVSSSSPEAVTATYTGNYEDLNVTNMSGTFDVTSNTDTKDIYFYATCLADSAEVPALLGSPEAPLIIFTNSQIGDINNTELSAEDVAIIRGGSQDPTASPNAIVLGLTIKSAVTEGISAISAPTSSTDANGDSTNNNVKYSIANCRATFTCTVGGGAKNKSFSTLDTNGLYKATLYLSTSPQAL